MQEAALLRFVGQRSFAGKVEHRGEFYPAAHAVIVESSVWEPIRKELRAKNPVLKRLVQKPQNPVLKGLLFCDLSDRPTAHRYSAD